MPFGLTNASSTFQATMNHIFQPHLRKFILVFFDDILIYSNSWDSHLHHIETTLKILTAHQLYANISKCEFGLTEIGYLGHIISSKRVRVDPQKITAIVQWPVPTSITAVRGFLGLTGYYRCFIQNYAHLASPLSNLLKKDVTTFIWPKPAHDAFLSLKDKLTSAPILQLPDFTKEFEIATDASGSTIGAVLTQSRYPIAYHSQRLPLPSKRLHIRQRNVYGHGSSPKMAPLFIRPSILHCHRPSDIAATPYSVHLHPRAAKMAHKTSGL